MLPFIVAALAAAGVTAAYYAMPDSSTGPKHEPGRKQTEGEKVNMEHDARKKAEEQIKRMKREADAKMRAHQEKSKADKKKVEEDRKRAEAEFTKKAEEIKKKAVEEALLKEEERRRKEREEYPMPQFLQDVGGTRMGGYELRFWDLPGAGTERFPQETYIQNMGLRYFDSIFVRSAGRWKDHDLKIIRELQKYEVPYFVVCTKVDVDIENNYEDNDKEPAETVKILRHEAKKAGLDKIYFITTKKKELKLHGSTYDNKDLFNDVILAMSEVRNFSTTHVAMGNPDGGTEDTDNLPPQFSTKIAQGAGPTLQWCSSSPNLPRQTFGSAWSQQGLQSPSGTVTRMMSILARNVRRLK